MTYTQSSTPSTSSNTDAQCLAAQEFVQAAITNPTLAQNLLSEIETANNNNLGNSSQATTQVNNWLQQQGYNTTLTLVYQAFVFAQNNELGFWTGIYGYTEVQYPNSLTLAINNQGTVIYNNQTINNPTVTPNNNNTLTVTWGFSNNSTAGNITFSVGNSGNGFKGTLQFEATGPAFTFSGSSYSTTSSNFSNLAAWAGSYNVSLSGFAPVLSIMPDSQGQTFIPYLGGVALSNAQFTPSPESANPTVPTLTWTDENGTSGNITFYFTNPLTYDQSTGMLSANSDGGAWFYGTLTFNINQSPQTWTYWGLIGQPVSFPLSNWAGYYGSTALSQPNSTTATQGPALVVQTNTQGQLQVLLISQSDQGAIVQTTINNWNYNCAYNLLTWTTNNNTSAGYITFAMNTGSSSGSNSSVQGLGFSGTLTQNGSTQNFNGTLSEPQQLSEWVGIYGVASLTSSNSSNPVLGPTLMVIVNADNTPQVTLNFGNNQIATLPTSDYAQNTNTLTWSSSTGVNTSGSITFAQQTAPTSDSSYVGNYANGTLTLPQTVGSLTAATYQYQVLQGQLSSGATGTGNGSSSSSSSSQKWDWMFTSGSNFGKWFGGGLLNAVEYLGKQLIQFPKLLVQSIPSFFAFEILGKMMNREPTMDSSNTPAADQDVKDVPPKTSDSSQPSELQQQQNEALSKTDQNDPSSSESKPSNQNTSETPTSTEPPKPPQTPSTQPGEQPGAPTGEASSPTVKVQSTNQVVSPEANPVISPEPTAVAPEPEVKPEVKPKPETELKPEP